MKSLSHSDRDLIVFHIFFAIVTTFALVLPIASLGIRILVIVSIYNIALPAFAYLRHHNEWIDLWKFLAPLSLFQIFPDWILSAQLGVLVFPDTGSPFVGTVPIFMAGMWIIPLFLILYPALRVESVSNRRNAIWITAALSAVLFLGSESTLWAIPIWYAQNVSMIFHVALYVIIPEIILGISAYLAFQWTRANSFIAKWSAAWIVMQLYAGGVTLFYFLVEKLILK